MGYGPESIIAFCNWYAAEYGLSKIKVRISEENSHSMHVFEKLGAVYIESTTYLSKDHLDMIKQKFPNEDLSELLKNDVRDYILYLPM